MEAIATKILRDPWEVEPRLAELGLSLKPLRKIAALAFHEGKNATPFHAANAGGTFAYQVGTWALRNQFVGKDGWQLDRRHSIEAIYNLSRRIRVAFSNVDVTCDDVNKPKPRSSKGAGAERAFAGNLFGDDLPSFTTTPTGDPTFYLMVDETGLSELTRPIIRARTFSSYVERIYLFRDDDDDFDGKLSLDDDIATDFDPEVIRRQQ